MNIKDMWSKIKLGITKKRLIWGGVAFVLIVLVLLKVTGENKQEFATVAIGNVAQEVASTGSIKALESVDLGFDVGGRVGGVYAKVGDRVVRGQTIAFIEAGDKQADVARALAVLDEELVRLDELKRSAPVSQLDSYRNLDAAVRESFAVADNAVYNKADQFFKNTSSNPYFELSFTDGNTVHYFKVPTEVSVSINASRKKVGEILENWKARNTKMSESSIVADSSVALSDLNQVNIFLDAMASIVNSFTPAEFQYQSTVNTYKTTISGARSEVSAAVSSLVSAKDKLNNAPSFGSTGKLDTIAIQESKVEQARAEVVRSESALNKSVIRAPFDGVITKQDAKVGASVLSGTVLVSLISDSESYIEANISEIHIAKIKEGNPVRIELDAFPSQIFEGYVSVIEPGEVLIDGVVNYKINVSLGTSTPRNLLKSGLTANLKIETARKDGVVTLPLYAIYERDGASYAKVIRGETVVEVPVVLGTSGNNGVVEVISGLEVGERVEI